MDAHLQKKLELRKRLRWRRGARLGLVMLAVMGFGNLLLHLLSDTDTDRMDMIVAVANPAIALAGLCFEHWRIKTVERALSKEVEDHDEIHESMAPLHAPGQHDMAARHNEHQP